MKKTLDDLFKEIQLSRKKLNFLRNEECFYRGQINSEWDLIPSLFRGPHKKRAELFWTESGLFYEFSTRAKQLHQQNLDDWDVLFYMRHYAVPTRLIDWTETLGVALYFATLDHDGKDDTCIWLLNPYTLNKISWAGRDLVNPKYLLEHKKTMGWTLSDFMAADWVNFQWKYPVAIYPPQKSDRMHAQRGWFTIHGTKITAMNKMPELKKCLSKIIIPNYLTNEIHEYLGHAGITDHTMFPDLSGLSKYLAKKYNFSV